MNASRWVLVVAVASAAMSVSGCWRKSPEFEAFRAVSAVMTREASARHFGERFAFDSSPYGDEGHIVTLLGPEMKRMWEVSLDEDPVFFVDKSGQVYAVNEVAAESVVDGVPMAAPDIQEFVHMLHDGVREAVEEARRQQAEREGALE